MSKDIVLIQTICGKYDIFILDMPLSLLYVSRYLVQEGYNVHILDQRVERDNYYKRLEELLALNPLWVGITAMTGEPVKHGVDTARFIRAHSKTKIIWGGIHPTILPEQTIASDCVDYIIRGKGEMAVVKISEMLNGYCEASEVPGLTYMKDDGEVVSNEEDEGYHWEDIPMCHIT